MTTLVELWAEHALALSLQVGALVLAAGVLSLVLRRASPRARYVVWGLVVTRALVPVVLVSPIGLIPSPETPPPPAPVDCSEVSEQGAAAMTAPPADPSPSREAAGPLALPPRGSIAQVLAAGWLLGVLGLGSVVVLRHRRLRREIGAGDPAPAAIETFVERQRRRLGLDGPVTVRVCGSRRPAGLAVVGVVRPVLVLPAWMAESWDETVFGPLVVHELVHLRRRDGWANLAVTVVQVLYFFHPLVWLATRLLVRERERVCDDEVVAAYAGRPAPYVRALCRYALAPAGDPVAPALSSLAASRADLVRRIERLAEPGYRAVGRRLVPRGLVLAAIVAGLVASLGARETDRSERVDPGLDLSAEIARLESRLRDEPNDLAARTGVLEAHVLQNRREDRAAMRAHARSLAEAEEPLDPLAIGALALAAGKDERILDETLSTWMGRLRRRPDDGTTRRQLVRFAARHRPGLASAAARRGEALEPDDPFWPAQLGEMALARGRSGSAALAQRAFGEAADHFRRAAERAQGGERLQALAQAARAELALGRPAEARRLAALELAEVGSGTGGWYEGNAVHEAHVLLGFAALAEGAVAEAESHLRRAGAAPSSPQLLSFGPDMSLAEALLRLGRTDAVLDYLDACRGFWEHGNDRLESWAAQIRRGQRPDFGPNRDYYR